MIYEFEFLFSLLFTIIIETAVLLILCKTFLKKKKIPIHLIIFLGILCSFATLPYLWFIIPLFIASRFEFIIFGEAVVILLESIMIYFILKIKFPRALIIALICNMISFLVGLVFF